MKLVPIKQMIVRSLLFLVIGLLVINFGINHDNEIPLNPINDGNTESDNNSSFGDPEQEPVNNQEQFDDGQNRGSLGISNQIIYNIIFTVLLFVVMILISFGYQQNFNSREVQNLVNTSLSLAGFDYEVSFVGREWQITSHLRLDLVVDTSPRFFINYYPDDYSLSPEMYGFKWSEDQKSVISWSTPEALQLTLQSLRRYILALEEK